jgi:hypothetical protein
MLKHVSTMKNMHTSVEQMLEAVFSNPSALKLCKNDQWDHAEVSKQVLLGIPIVGGCYQQSA